MRKAQLQALDLNHEQQKSQILALELKIRTRTIP